MALGNTYEPQIIELLGDRGDVVSYTVANGTQISKGSLMQLTDPRTMSKATAGTHTFAGIAAADKVALDGQVQLGAYRYGIFEMRCDEGAGVGVGCPVAVSGSNCFRLGVAGDLVTGKIIGKALEAFSAGEEGSVLVGSLI